jgi:putative cell wall-binding protein
MNKNKNNDALNAFYAGNVDGLEFSYELSLTVPSNVQGTERSELSNSITEFVASDFSERFGGATIVPAYGSYVGDDGALINEQVNVVSALTTEFSVSDAEYMSALGRLVGRIMKQETVLVSVRPILGGRLVR